jgi:hypothetical protein
MFYTLDKTHPNMVTFNNLEKVKEVTIVIKYHFKSFQVKKILF